MLCLLKAGPVGCDPTAAYQDGFDTRVPTFDAATGTETGASSMGTATATVWRDNCGRYGAASIRAFMRTCVAACTTFRCASACPSCSYKPITEILSETISALWRDPSLQETVTTGTGGPRCIFATRPSLSAAPFRSRYSICKLAKSTNFDFCCSLNRAAWLNRPMGIAPLQIVGACRLLP